MAILNRIDDLRESELPPNKRVEVCRLELACTIAGVLSLVKEGYRREIVKYALNLARQASIFKGAEHGKRTEEGGDKREES